MYRDGTVSIDNNSRVATGAGTKWVSVAGAQSGWEITFDGITFYHVSDVISDTELHIESILEGGAYTGETLNDVNYALRALPNSVGQLGNAVSRINDTVRTTQIREEAMTGWAVATSATFSFTDYTGQQFELITPYRISQLATTANTASNMLDDIDERLATAQQNLMNVEPQINDFSNNLLPAAQSHLSDVSNFHASFTASYQNWLNSILPSSQSLRDDTVSAASQASQSVSSAETIRQEVVEIAGVQDAIELIDSVRYDVAASLLIAMSTTAQIIKNQINLRGESD